MDAATLVAPEELMAEVVKLSMTDGTEMSVPVSADSPSDILDAPLNPETAQAVLEMVEIVFSSGTAIVSFATALIKLLNARRAALDVRDPLSGDHRGRIDGDTTPEEAAKLLAG